MLPALAMRSPQRKSTMDRVFWTAPTRRAATAALIPGWADTTTLVSCITIYSLTMPDSLAFKSGFRFRDGALTPEESLQLHSAVSAQPWRRKLLTVRAWTQIPLPKPGHTT